VILRLISVPRLFIVRPAHTRHNMPTPSTNSRLAVCSWSLQPADPAQLAHQLDGLGIQRVQLALDPLRERPEVWGAAPEILGKSGVTIVSGMFGTVGEDYSTLDSIRRTGGVVPDEHWEANWRIVGATVELAARLDLRLVTVHAGFLPHDPADPRFAKLLDRILRIADAFAGRGIELGFETGQESATTLRGFLQQVNRPNVGVNFDPANMILYDKGDPIEALRVLGPWLRQCHIKDANRTRTPGTWGEEVTVGTGQVDWKAFFLTLRQLGFTGDLCIEREAGNQRPADILTARRHVEALLEAL
jgi:L-ribulose-5-phosphate 3-epimerase